MFSMSFGLLAFAFLVFAAIFGSNGLPTLTLIACLLATLSTVAFVLTHPRMR